MTLGMVALTGGVTLCGVASWLSGRVIRSRIARSLHADLSVVLEQVPVPESEAAGIVRAWVEGQHCVSCGSLVSEAPGAGHHVALLDPSGITREWIDIGADRLTLALATNLPVCWNCHVSATFRRLHPELVTDRGDWPAGEARRVSEEHRDD